MNIQNYTSAEFISLKQAYEKLDSIEAEPSPDTLQLNKPHLEDPSILAFFAKTILLQEKIFYQELKQLDEQANKIDAKRPDDLEKHNLQKQRTACLKKYEVFLNSFLNSLPVETRLFLVEQNIIPNFSHC